MNKILRYSVFIIVILTTVVISSTVVLGYDWDYRDFNPEEVGAVNPAQQVVRTSTEIVLIIRVLGTVLGLVMVFILAIQYMTIGNVPEKKAALKLRTGMLATGVFLLVAIPGILNMFADIGRSAKGTGADFDRGAGSTGNRGSLADKVKSGDSDIGDKVFFDQKWGDEASTSSTGQLQSSSTTNPQIDPNTGYPVNSQQGGQQNSQTTPAQTTGYRATTASDPTQLKAGDRIYMQVADNGNAIKGGNWEDPNCFYELSAGAVEYNTRKGYYVLLQDGEAYILGNMVGKSNCFDGMKGQIDKLWGSDIGG